MAYKFGETLAAQQAREAEQRTRAKLAELQRLETELDARIQARAKALRYIKPEPTYAPTPETLAYHEQRKATNPNPYNEAPWHGYQRLKEAAREAFRWEHSRKAS